MSSEFDILDAAGGIASITCRPLLNSFNDAINPDDWFIMFDFGRKF